MARRRRRERLTEATKAVPSQVWAVTALFALLLIAWAQLVPLGQAPDEQSHGALIQRLADGRSYPEYDDFYPYRGTMTAWLAHMALKPDDAPPRGERPTLDQWGGRAPWNYPNQISQHPPLYYGAAAAGLAGTRAVVGERPLDQEWGLLRLSNVALMMTVPLVLWATVRRLGGTESAAVTGAIVPLMIPQLTYVGGSINNDNLLIVISAVLTLQLVGVARGDLRFKTSVFVGMTVAAGLWTKAFAVVFLPWIAVVYLVAAWSARTRGNSPATPILGGLIAGGTAVALGSAWWVRNLIRHGEPFPNLLDASFNRKTPGFQADPIEHLSTWIPSMVQDFWGKFALQFPISSTLVIAATVLAVIATVAALWPRRAGVLREHPSRPPPSISILLALASIIPMLTILLLYLDWSRYQNSGDHAFMQGRYMFAALAPFVVLIAVGADRLLGRRAPAAILVVALVMQAEGIRTALRGFWTEPGASLAQSLGNVAAWSPWHPAVLVALTAVLLAPLMTVAAVSRRRSPSLRSG